MSEVRLDLLFNASDALRAIDEIEARLTKLQGLKIGIGDVTAATSAVQTLANKLNEISKPINLNVNARSLSGFATQLSNISKQFDQALQRTWLGKRMKISAQIDTLLESMQPTKRISMAEVGGLYMFSNVLDRFAGRLGTLFDKAISAFEDAATSIQKTRIVSGAGPAEFNKFVSELRKLSGEVMTPYPELAEIAYAFATRGYANLQTAPEVIRPLAISSLITGESLDTMARSILSLMQAWNPRSLQSLQGLAPMLVRQFSDMMSYAFAKSPLEVRWFKDIANYAAPLFAQLGYSPQETLSFFMAMAQQIPTPGIGARSSRMLLFNIHDIERSFKVFQKYGIDAAKIFRENAEKGGNLADAFKDLYAALASLPKEQLTSIFKQLGGGVRGGMTAMMLQQGDLLKNISGYISSLEKASIGYTRLVQVQYRATPVGAYEAAQARITALLNELGEAAASAKTAILEMQGAMLRLANALPNWLVAGGYGFVQGARFSSNWIIDTMANVGLVAYLRQMLSGSALSGLLKWGLVGAGVVPIVVGGATAYYAYKQRREQEYTQEFISAYKGEYYIKAAADALKSAVPTYKNIMGLSPTILLGLWHKPTGYRVQTPEGELYVPADKLRDFVGVLGEFGPALEYVISETKDQIKKTASAVDAKAFEEKAKEIQASVQEFFAGIATERGIKPEDLGNFDALVRLFKDMGDITDKEATGIAKRYTGLFKEIESSAGGLLSKEGVGRALQQLLAAGWIEKATGISGIVEKLASKYKLKLTFEDIKPLIDKMAFDVSDIADKVGKMAGEQFKQDLGYGQLLDLWLRGYLPEQALRTTLPALKVGEWPIERTWVPGKYSETVAIGLPILTPDAITTSAYIDAAFKPEPNFN